MGTAFGTGVTLTIVLNGKTIFNDAIVPTVDAAMVPDDLQTINLSYVQNTLAEVANIADIPTDFAGSLPMSMTVTGGHGIILGDIQSNYQFGNTDFSGQSTEFKTCYFVTLPNSDESVDLRSSVAIDGVAQPYVSKGIWQWFVPAGSTISHDLNISKGQVGNALPYKTYQ